jgi:hypothetical protein
MDRLVMDTPQAQQSSKDGDNLNLNPQEKSLDKLEKYAELLTERRAKLSEVNGLVRSYLRDRDRKEDLTKAQRESINLEAEFVELRKPYRKALLALPDDQFSALQDNLKKNEKVAEQLVIDDFAARKAHQRNEQKQRDAAGVPKIADLPLEALFERLETQAATLKNLKELRAQKGELDFHQDKEYTAASRGADSLSKQISKSLQGLSSDELEGFSGSDSRNARVGDALVAQELAHRRKVAAIQAQKEVAGEIRANPTDDDGKKVYAPVPKTTPQVMSGNLGKVSDNATRVMRESDSEPLSPSAVTIDAAHAVSKVGDKAKGLN